MTMPLPADSMRLAMHWPIRRRSRLKDFADLCCGAEAVAMAIRQQLNYVETWLYTGGHKPATSVALARSTI